MIETSTGRWRPFIVTAIFSGMRASELRGLPWRDVDLDAGLVHVRQRADKGGHIGPPKSKRGKRDIPLPPIVVNALRQWQTECPKGDLGLVFLNGQGNVEGLSNIYDRFWQPLQIRLGLVTDTGEKGRRGQSDHGPPLWLSHDATCGCIAVYPVSRLVPQAAPDRHGALVNQHDF